MRTLGPGEVKYLGELPKGTWRFALAGNIIIACCPEHPTKVISETGIEDLMPPFHWSDALKFTYKPGAVLARPPMY